MKWNEIRPRHCGCEAKRLLLELQQPSQKVGTETEKLEVAAHSFPILGCENFDKRQLIFSQWQPTHVLLKTSHWRFTKSMLLYHHRLQKKISKRKILGYVFLLSCFCPHSSLGLCEEPFPCGDNSFSAVEGKWFYSLSKYLKCRRWNKSWSLTGDCDFKKWAWLFNL